MPSSGDLGVGLGMSGNIQGMGQKKHTHQETLQKKISLLSLLSWYCGFLAIGLVLQDKLQLQFNGF